MLDPLYFSLLNMIHSSCSYPILSTMTWFLYSFPPSFSSLSFILLYSNLIWSSPSALSDLLAQSLLNSDLSDNSPLWLLGLDPALLGSDWLGLCSARLGYDLLCLASALLCSAWLGSARLCSDRLGSARPLLGSSWLGSARLGLCWDRPLLCSALYFAPLDFLISLKITYH